MGATVRKNFVFEQSVVQHLNELAQTMNKSLTKVMQELIEERYKEIEKQKNSKPLWGLPEALPVFLVIC
jgi:macrodomain Ter protein organizer (MatP/YcbG family)